MHGAGRKQAEEIFQGLSAQLAEQVAVRPKDAKARAGLAMDCFYVAQRVPGVPNQSAIVESLYQSALVLFSELAEEFPEVYTYPGHMGHCHQNLGWIESALSVSTKHRATAKVPSSFSKSWSRTNPGNAST